MEARPMKRIGVISAAALFLLFGNTARSYAQQEHQEDPKAPRAEPKAKPRKQQETKQEAKPAQQQEEAQSQKQQEQPKTEKQQQATKPTKQEQEQQTKGAKQEENAKPAKQEEHAKAGERQPVQRTAEAEKRQRAEPALRLSARGSGRIPDDRFRSNFGQEHVFVISEPVMVGGFSRFQYSGFWFGFVDPWPVEWYYTDNVYVDFIDGGYYLCNPYYSGARVSINVVI